MYSVDFGKTRFQENVMIDLVQKRRSIGGNQVHVIEKVKAIDDQIRWQRFLFVVNEICCHIRVVTRRRREHVDVLGREDCKVLFGGRFGGEKEAPSLPGGDPYVFVSNECLLGVDPVDLDHRQGMPIELETYTHEISHMDDAQKVGFARFQFDFRVLLVIDQRTVRNRFQSVGLVFVFRRLIIFEEHWHLLVIPVGHREYDLVVHFIGIGSRGIMDNQWTSKSVRKLPHVMLGASDQQKRPVTIWVRIDHTE